MYQKPLFGLSDFVEVDLPIKITAPKCIDLFSGAGGLSLGLKSAGWKTVVAADFDSAACSTYRRNFPGVRVHEGDVRELDWNEFADKVDLVAGGPPCQPFSVAGDQKAQYDERDMLPEFVRAIKVIKPKLFLLENVAGLASTKHRHYLDLNLDLLIELGYDVHYAVLNAADYGVPQDRQRVIVLGGRKIRPDHPAPTHGLGRRAYKSAAAVLSSTPPDELNNAIITYAKNPVLRPSPWAGMLVNGGGRPINLSEPCQTIPASAGGNRTHIIDRDGVLLDYHQTLMSGSKPRSGLVGGVRRLTVRESARIQSFPDSFIFNGTKSSQYRQIGNAVPPKLGKAIGASLLSAL
jgi:DNA (cytosine-5)-methyltransferase 1